jgi:hypothetical protein
MFYILDCSDEIVGNPKGYRTFRGANQQAHSPRSKVYREIWSRYYAKRQSDPKWRLVSQIVVSELVY